jgi:uncharacterized ubiquitin-like protein YukD
MNSNTRTAATRCFLGTWFVSGIPCIKEIKRIIIIMFEREKLPKLKRNRKLIKLQEEINRVIDEHLEEEEMT